MKALLYAIQILAITIPFALPAIGCWHTATYNSPGVLLGFFGGIIGTPVMMGIISACEWMEERIEKAARE